MKDFGRKVWEAAFLEMSKALGGSEPMDYDTWYDEKYIPSLNKKKNY